MIFGFPSIHGRRWIKKAVHPLKGEYSPLSVWDTAKEHNRKKGGSRRLSQGAKKEQTIELRSKLGISSRTFTIPGGVPSMTVQRDCCICCMSPVRPLFKWEFLFFFYHPGTSHHCTLFVRAANHLSIFFLSLWIKKSNIWALCRDDYASSPHEQTTRITSLHPLGDPGLQA